MLKKFISFILVLTLLLTACGNMPLGNGTLSIDSGEVQNIKITNLNVNHDFTIADREQIHTIVRYLNSYTLDTAADSDASTKYEISVNLADGNDTLKFKIRKKEVEA